MVDDLRRLGSIPRVLDDRPGPARARSAPAALIRDLQWLRQRVLERLDSLEAMVRQHAASPANAREIATLERTLQQKLAELEEARSQLRADAERREKEWNASLTQLESDRRSLAEAWERVERQRIEGRGSSDGRPHPHAQGQGSPRGGPAALLHAALSPGRSAATDPEPNNPVARAILREFQTLSRDVRCNAEARRDPP